MVIYMVIYGYIWKSLHQPPSGPGQRDRKVAVALLHSPSIDHPPRPPRACSRCCRRSWMGPRSAHSRRRGRANQDSNLEHVASCIWRYLNQLYIIYIYIWYDMMMLQVVSEPINWLVVWTQWKIWKSIGMMTFPIYKHVPKHQPVKYKWWFKMIWVAFTFTLVW